MPASTDIIIRPLAQPIPPGLGGTGQSTLEAAIAAMLPPQQGNQGRVLTTDGTNLLWGVAGSGGSGTGTVTSVSILGGPGVTTQGGPITTSGTINISLADSGVIPGTFGTADLIPTVTVDSLGRVTGISEQPVQASWSNIFMTPTTLLGYGITDGAPLSHVGSTGSAHGLASPNNHGFMSSSDKAKLDGLSAGGGTGTVTSVNVSGGSTGLTFSGGPITDQGTITLGGTLSVASGGTGATTLSGILKGTGTTAIVTATPGTDYLVPSGSTYVGTTQISFNRVSGPQTLTGVSIDGSASSATDLSGGDSLQIPVQTASGATGFIAAPVTSGTYLQYTGSGFSWASSGTTTGVTSVAVSSGDLTVTGSPITSSGTINLTLNSVATAGTYRSVTVNAKGLVTSGTNPTTLSGYGITDAQPLDADLTAISSLSATSGILRKTAADTWSLDSTTYLTSNQPIDFSGDVTGSGSTNVTLTLANVSTAGTYRSVTVNSKGLVTSGTNPTTLSGYGITDALSGSTTSTQSGYFGDIFLFDDVSPSHYLQITNGANLTASRSLNINVNDGNRVVSLSGDLTVSAPATVSGTNTGDQTITLTGDVTGSGTGSFSATLANSGVVAGTYNNSATSVTPIVVDAKGRVTGFGSTVLITPAFGSITGKPTTLLGYGITDALPLSGGTLTGGLLGTTASFSGSVTSGSSGDGVVQMGVDSNGGIEIGKTGRSSAGVPFIDFHSSTNSVDYDARISASGGSATVGSGTITLTASQVNTSSGLSVGGNVSITGNLTVNGTTTTVNSTTVTVDDPVITLGGDTPPASDDGKDRGVEFRWHNGTSAKIGFFGFDDSTGKLTFIPDAVNTNEVFSGTRGVVDANIEWADVLNKPTTVSGYGISDAQKNTLTISNKTANYTVVSSDWGSIINCTSGTFTLSLTAAATLGSGFWFWAWNTSSSDLITIDPNNSETVDGVATLMLARGQGVRLISDGVNWHTGDSKANRGYSEDIPASSARPAARGGSSVALGTSSVSRLNGKFSYASGHITGAGDAQNGKMVLRAQGAGSSVVLTSDGSAPGLTNQMILPGDSSFIFRGQVIARNTNLDSDGKAWEFKGAVRRGATAGSVSFIGTPSVDQIGTDGSGWSVTLTLDSTNGGVSITGVGEAGKPISWVCTIETTEVTG